MKSDFVTLPASSGEIRTAEIFEGGFEYENDFVEGGTTVSTPSL